MKSAKTVQFIEKGGKPEWAIIPYEDFLRYQEIVSDAQIIENFQSKLAKGEEEFLPNDYAKRLIMGENAIKVWREFRQLTQIQLAEQVTVSVPYISQLEHGERQPSTSVLKKLAKTLKVSLDDLV